MSSVNRLTLKFSDKDALCRAVRKLDGTVLEVKANLEFFSISQYIKVPRSDVLAAFKLPNRRYPFVVKSGGDLITESSNGADETDADLKNLHHEYLFDLSSTYAETMGWTCQEEKAENGERLIALYTA